MNKANWGTVSIWGFSVKVGLTAWQVSYSSHTATFTTGEEPTLHCSSSHFIWPGGNLHSMNKVVLSTRPQHETLAKQAGRQRRDFWEEKAFKTSKHFHQAAPNCLRVLGLEIIFFFNGQMIKIYLLYIPTFTPHWSLQETRMLSNKKQWLFKFFKSLERICRKCEQRLAPRDSCNVGFSLHKHTFGLTLAYAASEAEKGRMDSGQERQKMHFMPSRHNLSVTAPHTCNLLHVLSHQLHSRRQERRQDFSGSFPPSQAP